MPVGQIFIRVQVLTCLILISSRTLLPCIFDAHFVYTCHAALPGVAAGRYSLRAGKRLPLSTDVEISNRVHSILSLKIPCLFRLLAFTYSEEVARTQAPL